MSDKTRTIKSVAFDMTDELEMRLLQHAEKVVNGKKRNFNRYVKRLIQAVMLSGGTIENPPTVSGHVDDGTEIYTMEV